MCGVKKIVTGDGGFARTVLLSGISSLNSSSMGSSKGETCHHIEPLPSIIPFPCMVSPINFVNCSHCNRPLPQTLKSVGAMIVPSNYF